MKHQLIKTIQNRDVPALGFGTFQLEGDNCRDMVRCALETGYRHIDTARMYANEAEVGRGIANSGVARESLFITSKVWHDNLAPAAIRNEVEASLSALDTDYLDLYLIHWPNEAFPLEASLEALIDLKSQGRLQEIGVSNFTIPLLEQALRTAPVFCNQVECHPFLRQKQLRDLAAARDLLFTAYSPLAQGKVHQDPVLTAIGEKHGKSPEQVALRWLVTREAVCAIPRSSKPEHIRSNFDIFDFELDADDCRRLEAIPDGQRLVNPDFGPDWD